MRVCALGTAQFSQIRSTVACLMETMTTALFWWCQLFTVSHLSALRNARGGRCRHSTAKWLLYEQALVLRNKFKRLLNIRGMLIPMNKKWLTTTINYQHCMLETAFKTHSSKTVYRSSEHGLCDAFRNGAKNANICWYRTTFYWKKSGLPLALCHWAIFQLAIRVYAGHLDRKNLHQACINMHNIGVFI